MSGFADLIQVASSMIELVGASVASIAAASFVVFTPVALAVTKQVTSTGKSFFFYRRGRGRR